MKVGLLFDDKRLEYKVMKALKQRGISFILINHTIDTYEVVLSDKLRDFPVILAHDADTAARRVVSHIYEKDFFSTLIVGIDPGLRPGVAVVGDGLVVEEIQLCNINKVRPTMDAIKMGYEPETMRIRIGNGDIVNRNRIINSIIDKYTVEIVNEKNTSNTITNRDVESAKHIAFAHGKLVHEPLNIVLRKGYLRELQRRSRIESEGCITISKNLAKKVALGEISLKRAINAMRAEE